MIRSLARPLAEAGVAFQRIYVAIQLSVLWAAIEFDWDKKNQKHLAAHSVTPTEVEHVLNNDPLDLDYELVDNEARYRSVGLTSGGRVLSVVWTIRKGKVRPITAFPSGVAGRKAFLKR